MQVRTCSRFALAASCLAAMLFVVPAVRAQTIWRTDSIEDPAWERFSVCFDNGCASIVEVGLGESEREAVRAILLPEGGGAAAERERLRAAIAQMERFVGEKTGTSRDLGGTFNFVADRQMDCIDESTNTRSYLRMFRRYGLMRHHEVDEPATRGWMIFGWPHTTAVMRETATGAQWAVDSWFLDNGEPPFILPLQIWRSGWKPGDPVTR